MKMAEKTKTTSSKGFNEKIAHTHILTPHNGTVVRKVMEHDTVSKTKQSFQPEDWHMLVQSKNQLKRKKKLSASLTSVGDTVNQEKRTRIEGIHLNIKSRSKDSNGTNEIVITKAAAKQQQQQQQSQSQQTPNKIERPVIIGGVNVLSAAPQRFKRKLQENVDTIQKLNALAEQLRLEVNELKSSLITERSAVRALRAQNDADSRKWRNDVKKLQQTLESTKKSNANAKKPNELAVEGSNSHVAADGLINHEIQRLTNEIAVLKEANRTKEEKTQIIGQADRQKAADMRQLKSAYENRLTQIQKSAKIEITRLLEEIKTKERNIGQLKKDLQTLQNGRRTSEAKTKPKTNESSQKLAKKPNTKDTTTKTTTTTTSSSTQTEEIPTTTIATKAKNETDTTNEEDIPPNPLYQAQVTSEITQLKNIELINNTKNVHKSTLEMRTTTATKTTTKANQHEEKNDGDEEEIMRRRTDEGTVIATTAWMETLLANSTTTAKPTTVEYRTKDNNSDTDSALSSAPPSISPQPPSSGADSGVMWQALQDLDKLQKEVEIYHKENERLQSELQLIKQELLSTEKAALSASGSSKSHINELLQRIKELEEQQLQLSSEADELREQNELLEFRILELEDDKMDGTCEDHCQRLENLLRKSASGGQLEDKDKRCLQQLLQCVQQLDLDAMAEYDSWQSVSKSEPRLRSQSNQSRIVATVQPYTNSATPSAPTTPSKRACHSSSWQSTSLSESGVFVECDLQSTHIENEAETETERLPQSLTSSPSHTHSYPHPHPHLQYYQERLVQLEGKLLVYESSGETQAKHLAERLQRELELNKQVKELIERVELLVEQNALLDEAKCEFEEAENDTRLHLQRNEEELEILRQRNVELEFSKDALGAKYRDCRAECLILREDLGAAETQLQHLQAERQLAKQQLESLRRSLPLLLICRLLALARTRSGQAIMGNEQSAYVKETRPAGGASAGMQQDCSCRATANQGSKTPREVAYLKEEVKSLRCSLQELNTRHYEAMETADSHWVELEREYKAREDAYRAKEVSLKQKIVKLQECLREDSRAAAEKIQQMEETEQGLKCCLVRLTKEHRDLIDQNRAMEREVEAQLSQQQMSNERLGPLGEALESEKRRSQALIDDLAFAKKLQQSVEEQLKAETDCLRQQIYELKKELMHIEVTNGELREEVSTLEAKIRELEAQLKASMDHAFCLEDELRTKDEQIEKMERKLGVCPEGYSLADELYDSPEKRAKREEIADLETASQGLGCALRDLERREKELPTHKDFQTIACSVKQLADKILLAQKPEVSEERTSKDADGERSPSKIGEGSPTKDGEGSPTKDGVGSPSKDGEGSPSGQRESEVRGKSCCAGDDSHDDDPSGKQEPEVCERERGSAHKSKDVPSSAPPKGDDEDSPCHCKPPNHPDHGQDDAGCCRTSAGQSTGREAVASEERSKGGTSGRSGNLMDGMSMLSRKLRKQLQFLTRLSKSNRALVEECSQLSTQSSPRISPKATSSPTVSTAKSVRRSLPMDKKSLHRRRLQCKRFICRRIYRTRVRRSGATNRQIELLPPLQRKREHRSFHSMSSFYSLYTDRGTLPTQSQFASVFDVQWGRAHFKEVMEWHSQLVQASAKMLDEGQQTDAFWGKQDCAIQAENVGVEPRLLLLPVRTRKFIELLQEKIVDDAVFGVNVFRSRVLQLWEGSEEFREHIELLQDLNTPSGSNLEVSYDIFVAVLGCVHALKLALKPCSSALLLQLEERINERLVNYHHRKVESEFYCTIYLPVERPNPCKLFKGKEIGA